MPLAMTPATDVELESAWTDLYLFEERYYLVVHFWMENLNQDAPQRNSLVGMINRIDRSSRTRTSAVRTR